MRALYFAEQQHLFEKMMKTFGADDTSAANLGYGFCKLLLEVSRIIDIYIAFAKFGSAWPWKCHSPRQSFRCTVQALLGGRCAPASRSNSDHDSPNS